MFDFILGKKKQADDPAKSIPKVSEITTDFRIKDQINAPIKNAIAVASGKGGVGKSTVSTNLALALAQDGAKVGLLDADIYGPNIPMMVGINQPPFASDNKIIPNEAYGMKVMSMGFLLKPDQPVVWRGPMLGQALRQFLMDVQWGELDYLVMDLPPGTGDVQLSLAQLIPITGGVIVTTPQKVALSDVRKGVATFATLEVPIVGVVENMSYFIAPDTGRQYDLFGTGGGKAYAEEIGVPFLGTLPIDPRIAQGGDTGKPILAADPNHPASVALRNMARQVAASLNILNRNRVPKGMIGVGDIPILS
jgi:ATP-binding protein involved in chromosome partitioning